MKHFIDARETMVTEALETAVALSGGELALLDGLPAIKVVVHTRHDRTRVAVISGGGSGHEPAHVGFVGEGMLAAAVCGEIFASPSVDAVLAAILAVTGPAGCLLVVKNYTGDRLNFGLAAEKARALGLNVAMVIVADDIAIAGAVQPRGLAGTLFVQKVAGHLAARGAPLDEVTKAAERVARSVVSIGAAVSSVTIPGQSRVDRMGPDEVELGLGIHGEPGATLIPHGPISALVETMVRLLEERAGEGRVALLINDLGGVPPIEMALVTRAVLRAVRHDVALVVGPARMMTALDMKGFSISMLPFDPSIESALETGGPPGWPGHRVPIAVERLPLPTGVRLAERAASSHPARRAMLETICATCIAKAAELDALDARIGDGDTGSTLATAARALQADLDHLPLADGPALCEAIADRLSRVMGGSSGILLAIFVAAMGPRMDALAAALRAGVRAVEAYGGARPGDRTMLDALEPAVSVLERGGTLAEAAAAAHAGAEATRTMTKAAAGRASYVRAEALADVPDPGAVAVAAVLAALG